MLICASLSFRVLFRFVLLVWMEEDTLFSRDPGADTRGPTALFVQGICCIPNIEPSMGEERNTQATNQRI